MTTTSCAQCNTTFAQKDLFATPRGLVCASCNDAPPIPKATPLPLAPVGIVGVVLGSLPFGLSFSTSSSMTINGVVEASSRRDYVALALGPVAAVCGALALLAATKATDQKNLRLGLAAGVIGLGLVQVLRGLGLV